MDANTLPLNKILLELPPETADKRLVKEETKPQEALLESSRFWLEKKYINI